MGSDRASGAPTSRGILCGYPVASWLIAIGLALLLVAEVPSGISNASTAQHTNRAWPHALQTKRLHRPPNRTSRARSRKGRPAGPKNRKGAAADADGNNSPDRQAGSRLVRIRVADVVTPASMQQAIDRCIGPVEIVRQLPAWAPHTTEIAEHNMCGGAAFDSLRRDQRIEILGGGLTGTYVVNGRHRFVTRGSSAAALDGLGDLDLQTCLGSGIIIIGLSRIRPSS